MGKKNNYLVWFAVLTVMFYSAAAIIERDYNIGNWHVVTRWIYVILELLLAYSSCKLHLKENV